MTKQKPEIVKIKRVNPKGPCWGCGLQDECRKDLSSGHSIDFFTKTKSCLVR